jgi:hypothetical protein
MLMCISEADLARAAGVPESAVVRLEDGQAVGEDAIAAICSTLERLGAVFSDDGTGVQMAGLAVVTAARALRGDSN